MDWIDWIVTGISIFAAWVFYFDEDLDGIYYNHEPYREKNSSVGVLIAFGCGLSLFFHLRHFSDMLDSFILQPFLVFVLPGILIFILMYIFYQLGIAGD